MGHIARLRTVASRLDGVIGPIGLFSKGGQYLTNPFRVVVADIAQMTGHREDEVVARSMFRNASQLFAQCFHQQFVGDPFVF